MLDAWWIWMVAGLVLAIMEVLAPTFIFLGFAIGAVLTGALVWFGWGWFAGSVPNHVLVFALLSLIAWVVLRALFRLPKGQVKVWNSDINDG